MERVQTLTVPTCDDARSLSSHDSLRKSCQLLGEESRPSQSAQHGRAHHLLKQHTTNRQAGLGRELQAKAWEHQRLGREHHLQTGPGRLEAELPGLPEL